MLAGAQELAPLVGVATACAALGVPRSSYYQAQQPPPPPAAPRTRPRPHQALSPHEEQRIRDILNSERFVDQAPRTIYATLLDEGQHFCSWRTMYRILTHDAATRERRAQHRRPVYAAPELLATGPRQVWSWDITKLRGPTPGLWYNLYVILDIFSRKIVGWRIETREDAELAEALIAESYTREGVLPDQLTLHADRGAPMKSKTVAELLIDLGVAQSHSRPTISDDNPYSESQFKTMKYGPSYPERFASLDAARVWMRRFAEWYNHEHKHSGIGLLPPDVVHSGRAPEVIAKRQATLDAAYAAHPARFPRGRPLAPQLPAQVGINLPHPSTAEPTPATTGALPAASPGSRVSDAQRPLDPGDAVGQADPEVLALEVSNAPQFA
jgi:putative transposase